MTLRMRVELVIFTFALALFLTAQSKMDRTLPNVDWITNTVPHQPTNWIDFSNVTNRAFILEVPSPSTVTIWFNVRVRSYTISDSITTNAWPVTASNALMMVKARFPEDTNSIIEHITLTGIWRDE